MSRACSSATNPPQLWWEAEPALSPHLMLTVTQKFFPLTPAGKIALKRVHFFSSILALKSGPVMR